jgi:hypothetical protein
MAKTVAPTMRTDFGRDLCERKGGSKHGVGKTLDHNEARSPRFLSLVRILPAENQNRGFEKAGGSEQESICFFVFSSGVLGEKKKQKHQSRHIYRIRSWRSPKQNKTELHEISIFSSRL